MSWPALNQSILLNNGYKMPILGLGTYCVTRTNKTTEAIFDAVKAGYRHFDGASMYNNEKEVGLALNRAMKEFKIPRYFRLHQKYLIPKVPKAVSRSWGLHVTVPT